MSAIPSSVVTAVAASAAAGKNPWLPLGLILVLAGPSELPDFIMDPQLHAGLHQLGPAWVLYTVGGVLLALAIADSLADKIGFIERWLTPISTAWRPFAAVAVSTLIAIGAANAQQNSTDVSAVVMNTATSMGGEWLTGAALTVVIVSLGAVYGVFATIGKTGTRLLLGLIPLPSIRLAHSFLDDLFALIATFAGLMLADSPIIAAIGTAYLVFGLVAAPLLLRLTLIHFRIGRAVLSKAWRAMRGRAPKRLSPPGWLRRRLTAVGVDVNAARILPAYVYRAPRAGWCRGGFLVVSQAGVWFAARRLLGARFYEVPTDRIARVGFSDTATSSTVVLGERQEDGALREVSVHLFPLELDEILEALSQGAGAGDLMRVTANSPSARAGRAGFRKATNSGRYLRGEHAGSLHLQGLVTVAVAIVGGVLSAGTFIPIGAGYLLSPFWRRFLFGFFVSCYLFLWVTATLGLAWPMVVVYATLLNLVALRDLARQAIRAHTDGFIDRRAFMPVVCSHVWIPRRDLASDADRWTPGAEEPITDGSWRAVWSSLSAPAAT